MSGLKIIRASAGSGKTYSLTEEYLKILINQPVNYFKKILAVTFTNKATAEMKSRILKELHILASSQDSNHLKELIISSKKNETAIREKASKILNHILHGYSWFRVETIDTFFQGIIRSFIRELNIPGNYSIELDQEKILNEAIDRFLDKIDNDKNMLNWVLEYIDSKISDGKSWVINNELQNLGKALFRENLIEKMPYIQQLIQDNNFLKTYRDTLYAITHSYESKITKLADNALSAIEKNGFTDSDFFYKGAGTISYFRKLSNKEFDLPGSRIETVLNAPEKWAPKTSKRKDELIELGTNTLNPTIENIISTITKEGSDYNTANSILKNLHVLGLLTGLSNEISELRHEKSLFLISDASPFIHKIINNNDTPFIYEKVGNHFNHLLIDEFQDTSSMQWGNFKPLIENSLAKNQSCLIVGDVKQSIYRWRSSNWEILEAQVQKEFHSDSISEKSLETNWRSDELIIQFNNLFFEKAAELIEGLLPGDNKDLISPQHIYKDVAQQTPKHKLNHAGYVNIKVFEKEDTKDNDEYFGEELIERINEMLANKYKPGDIALLVRNKKEGSELANYIIDAGKENKFSSNVGVISNESLFLNSSPVVRLLHSVMQFIYTPDDKIAAATVLANYQHVKSNTVVTSIDFPTEDFRIELLDELIEADFIEKCNALRLESLYILTEKLTQLLKLYKDESELVYLHSFLDIVFNYGSTERSDLGGFLTFWEEEGDKKSISAAETSGSVRILTIHKSKGLQFPVVIVPFCNWSIKPKANEKLWLAPNQDPYKTLPYLPIDYNKSLENSIFKTDFEEENYLTLIDNINLLYVAFTRAENALFVSLKNDAKELNATNKLIISSLEALSTNPELTIIKPEDEQRYIIGEPSLKINTDEHNEGTVLANLETSTKIPKVKISSKAIDFMMGAEAKPDHAAHGRILHSIMENIIHTEDIPIAVKNIVEQGILNETEGKDIQTFLEKAVQNKTAAHWFSNKYKVLNENDIIIPGGQTKRPDRVMYNSSETLIVDYKFGSIEENTKHIKQLEEYKKLLTEMNFKNIKAFVWYVHNNRIVEV